MNEKKIVIESKASRREFLNNFLKLLSITYPESKKLRNTEREVLIEFMMLPERFKYNRFSTDARKKVTVLLGKEEKTKYIVNNYLDILRSKGYITRDADDIMCLHPLLEKMIDVDVLELKFKFLVEDGKDS